MKKKEKEKSDCAVEYQIVPRCICDICGERFLFESSLTKNKEGKLICEKCLEKIPISSIKAADSGN